jgi:hypothetical protein
MNAARASSSDLNSSPKQYQCNICGKVFDNIEILNSHKKMEHSESGSQPPVGVG